MTWRKVQCICVEDKKSRLLGVISRHHISRYYKTHGNRENDNATVKDIMIKSPVVIHPGKSLETALQLMEENKMECLPVVEKGVLVGMITKTDFLTITGNSNVETVNMKEI